MNSESVLDEDVSIPLPCIRVHQPLGAFYVASIPWNVLREITYADVRQLTDREMDTYLGIQREVSPKRVKEIGQYVNTVDACFPTAVILAVDSRCAEFNLDKSVLTLRSVRDADDPAKNISRIQIARILDGQHRIEGLRYLKAGTDFEINVSIFVGMDIESQAYLFSKVNLAQTKVHKSLAYDLFEYASSRSPQKTAHNVAVALDRDPKSPFHERIKRLGVATKGRFTESLTQATVVESLLPYLSVDAVKDRDLFLRGQKPKPIEIDGLRRVIFRNMFLSEQDMEIAEILFNYFSAARERWPVAWNATGDGAMLTKTNGFRGLMRLLRPAYLYCTMPGAVVGVAEFRELFARAKIEDKEFNTEVFLPGSSGELALYRRLLAELNLGE
jgi:DGQHR domain-containing protein